LFTFGNIANETGEQRSTFQVQGRNGEFDRENFTLFVLSLDFKPSAQRGTFPGLVPLLYSAAMSLPVLCRNNQAG